MDVCDEVRVNGLNIADDDHAMIEEFGPDYDAELAKLALYVYIIMPLCCCVTMI